MNEILFILIFLIVIFGMGFAIGVKHMSTMIKDVEKIHEKAAVQEIKKAFKEMQRNGFEVVIVQDDKNIYIYSPRVDYLQLEWLVKAYPAVEKILKDANLVKVMEKIGESTIISYRPKDNSCTLPVSTLQEIPGFHEQLSSIHHKK